MSMAIVGGFRSRNLLLDRAQFDVAIEYEIDCVLVAGVQFLRDMRHRQVAGHVEAAILAGGANCFATIQVEGGVLEQDPRAETCSQPPPCTRSRPP